MIDLIKNECEVFNDSEDDNLTMMSEEFEW